jgi:hypothetical protein
MEMEMIPFQHRFHVSINTLAVTRHAAIFFLFSPWPIRIWPYVSVGSMVAPGPNP